MAFVGDVSAVLSAWWTRPSRNSLGGIPHLIVAICVIVGASALISPSHTQPLVQISVARLTLPGTITAILDPLKDQGIDRKHGIDLTVKNYSTVSAFYAAASTGEVDMAVAGPWVLLRLRNEGVPIVGVFTFVRASSMGVVTGDPALRTVRDLKGKTIAADMGSAEFQLLAMYGRSQGIEFGRDVTVVQAGPPLARTQLNAGRVDAAMSWETNTTLLLSDNSSYRRIFGGETAWSALVGPGSNGWQLLVTLHEDAVKRHRAAIPRLLDMWRDATKFLVERTAEAEAIDERTIKLPKGILGEALRSQRLVYDIQPVWDSERAGLQQAFKLAVDGGFVPKLPEGAILYAP
jgi:ABC-type nitrate/sulfonate/bicarbonate transport system substrate-binding protein